MFVLPTKKTPCARLTSPSTSRIRKNPVTNSEKMRALDQPVPVDAVGHPFSQVR
jgi:hypothetical protein